MEQTIGKKRIIFIALAFATGAGAGFLMGSHLFQAAMADYRLVKLQLAEAKTLLAEKEQQLINLDIADKVNKLSQEKLRSTVTELKTQQVKLEGELFLYKNLVEDDQADMGLNLETVTLRPVQGQPERFHYQVVVRRKATLSQTTDAFLTISVEGRMQGVPGSLMLKEVDSEIDDDVVDIRFKYFKVLQGQIELPARFEPERLVITLYEEGRADSLVIKEVPWRLAEF
jgi:ribosomal protein L29